MNILALILGIACIILLLWNMSQKLKIMMLQDELITERLRADLGSLRSHLHSEELQS